MPKVKCSVSNCYYHEGENNCTADSIMVDIETNANNKFYEEFGDINGEYSVNASGKLDTICNTFKPVDNK